MVDIFLMGTSGNYNDPKRSLWRERIKAECQKVGLTYFDPVVPVWTEELGRREVEALQSARILIMAITSDTVGMASLAESGWSVLSAILRKQAVGMYIDPEFRGEKTTQSTMMVRLDEIRKGTNIETIDEASRRARKLVKSHATNLRQQFPSLNLYVAETLPDLTVWTITTAKKLGLGHKR